jgi:hypothetical protein
MQLSAERNLHNYLLAHMARSTSKSARWLVADQAPGAGTVICSLERAPNGLSEVHEH